MELGLSLGDKYCRSSSNSNMSKEGDIPDPPLQLDLLPFSPVPRNHSLALPWRLQDHHFDYNINGSSGGKRLLGLLQVMGSEDDLDAGAAVSSSRANTSDDDENALLTRKKLRLSKDQSVFLEQSFKEHNTLNPKEKLALAKQLNLRPRQVEVWFQNRRARTKLKQTEVDCEYLKRCCETLTEENRRLQKELQELRALKANTQPFFMQLPATTLTICPSCDRTSSATTPAAVPPAGLFPNFQSNKAAS